MRVYADGQVWFVDELEQVEDALAARLEAAGYKVVEAVDGNQALELTNREAPDLVILDVVMPKIGGLEACRRVVRGIYTKRLDKLDPSAAAKDPKTALQEYLQARQRELPRYETTRVSGPPHEQVFTVTCHVDSLPAPVTADGNSRRKAEQAAARAALRQLRS